MATLNWAVGTYGRNNTVMRSGLDKSGNETTTGTASDVTTVKEGDVVQMYADAAVWVNFQGDAAAGTGFFIPGGETREIEVDKAGTLSAING